MADRTTTPREWAIAIGGGLLLAAGLVWMLRGSEPAPEPVELTAASPPAAVPPAAVLPPPAPVEYAVPTIAPSPLPAGGGDYMLRGLIVRSGAASAIVESSDGRQRLVRTGSVIGPGARVESIDPDGVVIVEGDGRKLLGFADGGAARAIAAPPAGPISAPLRDLAASGNEYRLGLKARKVDGRTSGFVATDLARLPALRKAGMMPGDVLVSLNGSAIESEEKLLEMPAEIAGAYAVDVVYERAGKRQRGVVAIER